MFHEDEPRATPASIRPGEDLSALSVEELRERKAVLESEIARAEAMIEKKEKGRAAADAVFRKGG